MPLLIALLPKIQVKSRRFVLGAFFAVLSVAAQYLCGAWYTSLAVFALLFLAVGAVRFPNSADLQRLLLPAVLLGAACVTYYCSQSSQGGLNYLSLKAMALGVLFCLAVLLLSLLLLARPFPALCVGMTVLMLFATVNFYVFKCRGMDLLPADLYVAKTALSVVGNYDLSPNLNLVRAWLIVLLYLFGASALVLPKLPRVRLTLVSVPAVCLMAALFFSQLSSLPNYQWAHMGTYYNGTFVNFMRLVQLSRIGKPEGYDLNALEALTAGAEAEEGEPAPTIIVIMNESFADLRTLGPAFRTDEEVMPFVDSLRENTVRGFAQVSVYGGTTPNSEYEFLTGNTMGLLPTGAIPFQQYIHRPTYSMVSVLKERGYTCLAMHPYLSGGYMRNRVYPLLGFDESYFLEDFEDAELVRDYVGDLGMYKRLIEHYEQAKQNQEPLFIFGVTMQNHGYYNYDESLYPSRVHLTGLSQDYPVADQYLTLIRDSDEALSYLITYFSQVEEDVVLVFYGDHQPNLEDELTEELFGHMPETLDELELEYRVPFLIWTNYDIPEKEIELTSLNYLSSYVYEAAGMTPPGYNRMLAQLEKTIPVINSLGYYSPAAGTFLPVSEAEGEEAEALALYSQLAYNNMFDEKNLLSIFRTDR